MLATAILPLSLLVAGVQASLLTLRSPRFTVTSSTGDQLRSETYVSYTSRGHALTSASSGHSIPLKISSPLTLSQSDVLKLTFQVVEKDTGNGVQPHQTFLRFFDHKTGEEGIQPVRVTPGGKAKFELVCFPTSIAYVYNRHPCRTWRNHRYPYHRALTRPFKCRFSSGPPVTRPLLFLCSTSRYLPHTHPPSTQTKRPSISFLKSIIPSDQNKSFLLGPSPPSSQQWFLSLGSFYLAWYALLLFQLRPC